MARQIFETPLEIFVRSYLRQFRRRFTPKNKQFFQKALAYVTTKLENNYCCDDVTVNLFTRLDNDLTLAVEQLVKSMPLAGNKRSLMRVQNMLIQATAGGPCCTVVVQLPITFEGFTGSATFEQDSDVIVTVPSTDGTPPAVAVAAVPEGTYEFCIEAEDILEGAVITVVDQDGNEVWSYEQLETGDYSQCGTIVVNYGTTLTATYTAP